ncbi:MAG: ORF6N domain-containing protein [Magnetococcales bacterium]|nr:ORF6N domain-containing protein [Magnetococcales bacterium]
MNRQLVTVQSIRNAIISLPGREPFMLGQDLAAVYEVEPRAISQAVKRNQARFPDDFVFRLTDEETAILKSQIVTSNLPDRANRGNPLGFTRSGANMLSTVLRSPMAAQRSVEIMRAFSTLEERAAREAQRRARQAERRATLEWQQARSIGKEMRHQETDTIRAFVEYARSQGSRNADRYYLAITRMVNAILLDGTPNRDALDAGQLTLLAAGERLAGQALQDAMGEGLPYRACFQAAKMRVVALGTLLAGVRGQTMLAANSPDCLPRAG